MSLSEIDLLINSCRNLTGKMPSAIYLGLNQWHDLCKYAFESGVILDERFHEDNIPEYQNIKVYKINARSHLGVGV